MAAKSLLSVVYFAVQWQIYGILSDADTQPTRQLTRQVSALLLSLDRNSITKFHSTLITFNQSRFDEIIRPRVIRCVHHVIYIVVHTTLITFLTASHTRRERNVIYDEAIKIKTMRARHAFPISSY